MSEESVRKSPLISPQPRSCPHCSPVKPQQTPAAGTSGPQTPRSKIKGGETCSDRKRVGACCGSDCGESASRSRLRVPDRSSCTDRLTEPNYTELWSGVRAEPNRTESRPESVGAAGFCSFVTLWVVTRRCGSYPDVTLWVVTSRHAVGRNQTLWVVTSRHAVGRNQSSRCGS
ncbi:Hypothetical predicted protein [Scomber scombrus]|uniref:Uncharacterized protein n=1 Tax=Scomber scombrus TaxID=13677 RepID=A0AAV1QD84_SCOSC